MRRPMRVLVLILMAAAIAAFVVFGLASHRSVSVGRVAPALPHEALVGSGVTLAHALASARGQATLVTFWASWCEPCVREAAALERFSRSPSGRGRLIGVDWSDGLPGARRFVAKHGWTFPNVRDSEGTVGNDYRLSGLPTTFVIDPSGRIKAELRGPQSVGSLERAMASVAGG